MKDLSEDDVAKLREAIEHEYAVEGDLRRDIAMNIKRLIEIDSYTVIKVAIVGWNEDIESGNTNME